ncbi:MAG TPA: FkbM family methyltransferase [Xanthobacteraceae bacterium]
MALPALDLGPAEPGALWDRLRAARGLARSLVIYYGNIRRRAAMDRLYRRFVKPGDLVFDIGAHVGDRVGVFRRLGARVVAVEPQPMLVRTLRLIYGRDAEVAIEPAAVGRHEGSLALRLNLANPTVSTASEAFVRAAAHAPGWRGQRWTKSLTVPLTTLDALIARHGAPAFVKIDVEGFEAEALAGLSAALPALSFEFTTLARAVALAALARCAALGFTRFDAALGESQVLVHGRWIDAGAMAAWLAALPDDANSGDIYALL